MSISTSSFTIHFQNRHLESLDKRSKCGRTRSSALKVSLDRYLHLLSLGRQLLEAKGITDVVIQGIAETLRWQKLDDLDVVLQLVPSMIAGSGLADDATVKVLMNLTDLEKIALADAVEMMFSRYQTEEPK